MEVVSERSMSVSWERRLGSCSDTPGVGDG